MKKQKYLKLILFILLMLVTIAQVSGKGRRDAAYVCGIDGSCQLDQPLIERYDLLMGYSECGSVLDSVKKYNPNSLVFLYTSGTDNYTYPGVTSGNYYGAVEHYWLSNRCIELGYSPEILYLHFYDDSEVSGNPVPGAYTTNLIDGDSLSRAFDYPDYYSGNGHGRILVNFAHPITRQLSKEYACMVFDSLECSMWRHLDDRTEHFDGYYMDNWMYNWGRRGYGAMGNLEAGGRIAETPDASLIYGSLEFSQWYWEQMKLFATELRDTLAMGESWTPDGKRKYLAYNTGQSWTDDYSDPNIGGADYLNMEFLFNPIKNVNESTVYSLTKTYTHDSTCAANGVTIVYCSREYIADDHAEGLLTYSQSIYDNLCFYYVARSDSTYIFMRPGFGNAYGAYLNPGWDSLTWCGAMDHELGSYTARYSDFDSGTDPSNYEYNVYARQYQNGLVLIRPRGAWGQDFDDATKVTLSLPGAYRYLAPDGTLGGVITSIQLRNGEGAILIPGDMGDCTSPPTVPSLYSPGNGQEVGTRPTLCVYNSDGGDCNAALSYDFQISTTSSMSNIIAERPEVGSGSSTTCYTPSVDLSGGQTYFWRARAFNGTKYSNWSSVRSFMVTGSSSNQQPAAPILSSPGDGATVGSQKPTLIINNSFDADGDNLTYQFQVSGSSSFASTTAMVSGLAEGSGSTTSWIVSSNLIYGENYYWRVRAYDGSSYSYWSSVRMFAVSSLANSPPTIPIIGFPTYGTTINTLNPVLVIRNSTDPNGDQITYQIEVSINNGFNTMAAEGDDIPLNPGTYTYWQVNRLLTDNEDFWWRVRATDGESYSAYCEPAQFFVEAEGGVPINSPEMIEPQDQAYLENTAPILKVANYNAESDYDVYYFEIWDQSRISRLRLSPIVAEGEGEFTIWQADPFLDRGKLYYWRCRAYGGQAYSDWTEWRYFNIAPDNGNLPPTIPVLYLPVDGDTLTGSSHVLVVLSSSDPDKDQMTYDFRIAANYSMSELVESALGISDNGYVTVPYFTTADFINGETYFWQVRSYDGYDYSDWSEKRSFTHFDIVLSSEDVPTLLYPGDGELIYTIQPQFILQTNETDIDVNFFVQVADNQEFFEPILSKSITGTNHTTTWEPVMELAFGTNYFWRAKAENSDWSNYYKFTVNADVHVIPNPYRPEQHGEGVIFKNIPAGSTIKIADVNGDFVKELLTTDGVDVVWDVTNDAGNKLASGVYLYYVISQGAIAQGKLAIIR